MSDKSYVIVRSPNSKTEEVFCRGGSLIHWQCDNVATALFPDGTVWRTDRINGVWQPSTVNVPKLEE